MEHFFNFCKVSNPASDATNSSAFVGQFTAGTNNDIGIGVIDPTNVFTSPFNLESNSIFKMKVFSTEEIDVIFHLENSPDYGNNIEVTASVGASDINKWTELIFDFSNFSNIFMNNIVLKIGGSNTLKEISISLMILKVQNYIHRQLRNILPLMVIQIPPYRQI